MGASDQNPWSTMKRNCGGDLSVFGVPEVNKRASARVAVKVDAKTFRVSSDRRLTHRRREREVEVD
jgi:hypothetical protein